jgi:hypothetical protein
MKLIYVLMALAGCFALASVLIAMVFLRQVPRQFASGTIVGKDFKPAGTYSYTHMTGRRSGFFNTTTVPIAECYVFTVRVEGFPEDARYPLNTVAAREFEVSQRVKITYETRSFPLLWKRVYVTDMARE